MRETEPWFCGLRTAFIKPQLTSYGKNRTCVGAQASMAFDLCQKRCVAGAPYVASLTSTSLTWWATRATACAVAFSLSRLGHATVAYRVYASADAVLGATVLPASAKNPQVKTSQRVTRTGVPNDQDTAETRRAQRPTRQARDQFRPTRPM